MIRSLIFSVIAIIAIILGITIYLQPNDFSKCGSSPSDNSDCRSVDAIVAVSGGDTAARAREAVTLYKNGWSDVLIFAGAAEDKTGPSNAAEMKTIATAAGVSEDDIYIDEYSENTKQNAENVQTIFTKLNVKRAILVTSGYHQRRASLELDKYTDATILNYPVDTDNDWSIWWWVKPHGWWLAGSELVKIGLFYTVGA